MAEKNESCKTRMELENVSDRASFLNQYYFYPHMDSNLESIEEEEGTITSRPQDLITVDRNRRLVKTGQNIGH